METLQNLDSLDVILTSMSDGALIVGSDGLITRMNPAAEILTGLSAGLMTGKPFVTLFPRIILSTGESCNNLVEHVLTKGNVTWQSSYKTLGPDHSPILTITGSAARINYPGCADTGILLVFQNIAGRNLAEREAKEARELFGALFFLSPVAYSLATFSERMIVNVNAAWENLYGYSPAEVIGHEATEFDFWQNPEQRETAYQKLKNDGRLWDFEFTLKRKSGDNRFVSMFTEMIEQNGIKYIFSVTFDLTDRKAADKKLQESETLLRQILQSAPDAVFAIDRNYHLLINNQRHQQTLTESGSRPLAVGENVQPDDYPPDVRKYWREAYDRALAGEEFRLETTWTAIDGRQRIFENNFTPLRDASGEIIGALVVAHDITSRKKAETALRESQSMLQAVLDNSPGSIYLKDRNSRLLLANPATFGIIGKPPEACLGKTDAEFYDDPATSRLIMENDRRIMQSGRIETVEESVFRPEGTRIYLSTKAPFRNPEGQIVGLIGLTREITEQKHLEDKMRQSHEQLEMHVLERTAELEKSYAVLCESEERYKLITELLPIGIAVHIQGRLVMANPAGAQILGYKSVDEVIGRNIFDFIHPAQAESSRERIARAMRDDKAPPPEEMVLIKPDGGEITVLTTGRPFINAGKPAMMIAVLDITQRKRTENALHESEEKYAAIFEKSALPTVLTKLPEGTFSDMNKAFEMTFGYDRKAILGKTSSEIGMVDEEQRQKTFDEIGQSGSVKESEKHVRTRSGELRKCLINVNKLVIGGEDFVITTINDITGRKRAEEDLKKSKDEMQKLASHIQDIREQEKKAIAGEVHDELGQKLAGLKMDLSWLSRKITLNPSISDKLKEMNNLIDESVEVIHHIISNLHPPVLDDLGLADSIRWLVNEVQKHSSLIIRTEIDVKKKKIPPSAKLVIFRVIQEALTNTVKHASATSVFISVGVEAGTVKISVRDNGRGISRKAISGSGSFGLLGMRERINSINGTFSIKGLKNKGTTLVFTIPIINKTK